MLDRRHLLRCAPALLAVSLLAPVPGGADEPIPAVATFSVLGDMVQRIGGDLVSVTTLVGPEGDTHVYRPDPADARAVSNAEILVFNGLGFEGWLDRLIEASDFDGVRVVATDGIKLMPLDDDDGDHKDEDDHKGHDDHKDDEDHKGHDHHRHDHGAFDPHAWQYLANGVVYVDNITAALAKADPANASTYYGNRESYVAEIRALDDEIRATVAALPEDRRTIITPHDAFGYFSQAYGLRFLAPVGISTESEPSAADVADLIRQIREQGIGAVFVESITDARLLQQIADETGASIGGTLYSDALSGPEGPASTYLDMMRHNITTLAQALSP